MHVGVMAADIAQLEVQVDEIRAGQIADKSRSVYKRSTVRFLQWLYVNKPALLSEDLLQKAEQDGGLTREHLTAVLDKPNAAAPPLRFGQLTARDFVTWIVSLDRDTSWR